jgi:hypothetical protein
LLEVILILLQEDWQKRKSDNWHRSLIKREKEFRKYTVVTLAQSKYTVLGIFREYMFWTRITKVYLRNVQVNFCQCCNITYCWWTLLVGILDRITESVGCPCDMVTSNFIKTTR